MAAEDLPVSVPTGRDPSDAGFRKTFKTVNTVLACLVGPATGWTNYGTFYNVNRFRNLEHFFGSVKFPLPHMTMALYHHKDEVIVVLIVLAASCAVAANRQGERRETLYLNIAGVLMAMAWWIFHTTLFYAASMSILERIPSPP